MAKRQREPVMPQGLARLRAARQGAATLRYELEEQAAKFIEEGMEARNRLIAQLMRELYDAGESVANIKRAYGTQDYRTVMDIIESTEGTAGLKVMDDKYSYDDDLKILSVNYVDHGTRHLTGAVTIGVTTDPQTGELMLLPRDGETTPPFGEDYTMDPIVQVLTPLSATAEYRDEALEFLGSQSVALEKKPKKSLDKSPAMVEDSGNDLRKFLKSDEDDELGGFE